MEMLPIKNNAYCLKDFYASAEHWAASELTRFQDLPKASQTRLLKHGEPAPAQTRRQPARAAKSSSAGAAAAPSTSRDLCTHAAAAFSPVPPKKKTTKRHGAKADGYELDPWYFYRLRQHEGAAAADGRHARNTRALFMRGLLATCGARVEALVREADGAGGRCPVLGFGLACCGSAGCCAAAKAPGGEAPAPCDGEGEEQEGMGDVSGSACRLGLPTPPMSGCGPGLSVEVVGWKVVTAPDADMLPSPSMGRWPTDAELRKLLRRHLKGKEVEYDGLIFAVDVCQRPFRVLML